MNSEKRVEEIKLDDNNLNVKSFFAALKQVAKQNLLSNEEIMNIIKEAVYKSFHHKFDPDADLELVIDEATEAFKLINKSKLIIEDDEYEPGMRQIEIPLSEARKLDKHAKAGDLIAEEVDFHSYSKTIAAQIRQIITQSIRESKKGVVWEKYKDLKGKMIDVTVTSITNSYVVFVLEDNTSAFMPAKLRNNKIPLKIGERVKVFVEDVLRDARDSQIVVSNGSTVMVRKLLELEVPEIADGTIEIMSVSRIAGERTKIAVRSKQPNVDPIGAVIGAQGTRINTIVTKLNGEKIDVVPWSADLNKFVASALAPARVIMVYDKLEVETEENRNQKIAIVPDKHQTLAIGRGGSNVRLAVELVNKKIDVIPYTDAVNRGIHVVWNGNITQEEVKKIDAGERIGRSMRGEQASSSFNNRQNSSSPANRQSQQSNFSHMFDEDISNFNEQIGINKEKKEKAREKDYEVNDAIFTEDELKQMEANFEFDDEIASLSQAKTEGKDEE